MSDITTVILAAGNSTRFKASKSKLVYPLCGLPIISHIFNIAKKISGTNILILSKADVIKELNIFKYISQNKLKEFNNYDEFLNSISSTIQKLCSRCFTIHISDNPFAI